jgi:hypothetical protein
LGQQTAKENKNRRPKNRQDIGHVHLSLGEQTNGASATVRRVVVLPGVMQRPAGRQETQRQQRQGQPRCQRLPEC